MNTKKNLVVVIFVICKVTSKYEGEGFPEEYLDPDGEVPTDSDLDLYLDRLLRLSNYITRNINQTDVNQAISAFLATAMLKRTLQDYSHKLGKHKSIINILVEKINNIISHYVYLKRNNGWKNLEYRLSKVYQEDKTTVHSIRSFSSGLFRRWLRKFSPVNEFVPSMDNLSLPKEKFVELVETMNGTYDITGYDSDKCLFRLVESISPLNETSMRPCKPDHFCREKMFLSPSVAYTLSHRLLNSLMYMHARRCYHYSPSYDSSHMDILCTAMYREAVYIARRGYFHRDLFLEQIGLCGHLGYVEFHRRRWFHKTASWIDEDGCMQEFANFEINRTKLMISMVDDGAEKKKMWKALKQLMQDDCHHHPMAVAMMALANGVRHAAHFK